MLLALVTSNKHDNGVCFLVSESSVNSTKGFFGKTKIHKSRQILRKKKVRMSPDLDCEFLRVARTRQDAQNFLCLIPLEDDRLAVHLLFKIETQTPFI
jgi:hypothetical protein